MTEVVEGHPGAIPPPLGLDDESYEVVRMWCTGSGKLAISVVLMNGDGIETWAVRLHDLAKNVARAWANGSDEPIDEKVVLDDLVEVFLEEHEDPSDSVKTLRED